MAKRRMNLTERFLNRRAMRRWSRHADRAATLDLSHLRALRSQALGLRRQLDRLLFVADGRLTLPRVGSNAIRKPLHADWAWRPEVWRGPITPAGQVAVESKTQIGEEVTLFHDCRVSELTLRQLRNTRDADLAPFGLRMDVFRFDGSFLSLVVSLPDSAAQSMRRNHLVGLTLVLEFEKPLEVFARLNIQHGPNTEQMVRELPIDASEVEVEFDLAYSEVNDRRIERAWLDLIFEGPEMNQVTLRDVTFTRRPRAEL